MTGFDTVLVANRGEIAVRVLRTARDLGYRTVAVYSEADRGAPHVRLADLAVLIGPAPVAASYLDPGRILAAALRTGAQAIHPGYGFLSENAAFARACAEAGLVFIGPSPEAIDAMGDKARAKRRMLAAGVPCVPGYQGEDQADRALLDAAEEVGFPLMVKASAGGGGRGMRLVDTADALPAALASARSEAENAFGSGELILERAVARPRHVEIQVFGDVYGNVIQLGERDCSVQRRHQKVVEEAPCPVLTPALREAMGQAAVDAARAIDYVGAGTVEFLLDAGGDFYFLEMNTRLQVEHPVTELVTGLDLVALQLDVAQGRSLPLTQDQVELRGHAIEVRLYAEDSQNDFLPAAGTALRWQPPDIEGVRVDHGLRQGQQVSPFYDPMVAKIIATGPDREVARRRLLRALDETVLVGFESNRELLQQILRNPVFAEGGATTAFIAEQFPGGFRAAPPTAEQAAVAACVQLRQEAAAAGRAALVATPGLAAFSGSCELARSLRYDLSGEPLDIAVSWSAAGRYRVVSGDATRQVEWLEDDGAGRARIAVDGLQQPLAYCVPAPGQVAVQLGGQLVVFTDALALSRDEAGGVGSGSVTAPMHGNLQRVLVTTGDRVTAGDSLAVIEAMKLEYRLIAEVDGTVLAVHAAAGDQVAAGAVILEIGQGQ